MLEYWNASISQYPWGSISDGGDACVALPIIHTMVYIIDPHHFAVSRCSSHHPQ